MTTCTTDIAPAELRRRVLGCWLGKAVGGTLGQPYEGVDGPLNLSFYDPVPAEMIPNDDLDLQVVWACVMDAMDPVRVDRHDLAKAWRDHVRFPFDEYGVGLRNLAEGLEPPATGGFDNWFTRGMGAAIRSELWACLAAGDPELAGAYAYEDACFDHAGEGVDAEVFLAALQAAAFTESDCDKLLDAALTVLSEQSQLRRAIEDTRRWWVESGDWLEVRGLILEHHGHENFTDVVMNLAFTVLGWLAGGGDFGRSICIAVNCGKDTDCTGATLGALLGILDPDSIDDQWLRPIGRDLVLSPEIVGIEAPATLDGFTDLVLGLRRRLSGARPDARPGREDTAGLTVPIEIAFTDDRSVLEPGMPAPHVEGEQRALPGTWASMPAAEFGGDVLLLRYRVHLDEPLRARVVFNTHQASRVWIAGREAFGRGPGPMCPAAHRPPQGQYADLDLSAGEHDLIAAVARPQPGRTAHWVACVADAKSRQWVPHALRPRG